jgi:hypothetical protein
MYNTSPVSSVHQRCNFITYLFHSFTFQSRDTIDGKEETTKASIYMTNDRRKVPPGMCPHLSNCEFCKNTPSVRYLVVFCGSSQLISLKTIAVLNDFGLWTSYYPTKRTEFQCLEIFKSKILFFKSYVFEKKEI